MNQTQGVCVTPDEYKIQRQKERAQAIEYRRQLLRVVDQIEQDYKLGKYATQDSTFDAIREKRDVDTLLKRV